MIAIPYRRACGLPCGGAVLRGVRVPFLYRSAVGMTGTFAGDTDGCGADEAPWCGRGRRWKMKCPAGGGVSLLPGAEPSGNGRVSVSGGLF